MMDQYQLISQDERDGFDIEEDKDDKTLEN